MSTIRCNKNANLIERLGQFEILEANMWDEVMTSLSEKLEILVNVKILQNKIASVTTDITVMKDVNEKLEKYNELLDESSKHQTKLNETLLHDNYEVLMVNKDL